VTDFDLIVVGTGPAGEKGAVQAAYFGKRVAVVERHAVLGGARITSCALPSKNLRETALALAGLRRREAPSVRAEVRPGATLADLMCRHEPLVANEIARVRANLTRHGIEIVLGAARFEDPHTLRVDGPHGVQRLRAPVVLLAPGSSPHRPPGIPFDDPDVHDSDEILAVERIPASLTVVGGGVIGSEFATMLGPLGVRVTLLERGARLLPFADAEMSRVLTDSLPQVGVEARFGVNAVDVRRGAAGIVTRLDDGGSVVSEQVLVCAGRTGNTADLALDAAGLAADARGRLAVNDSYQTAVPHIYAAGDVIGFPALASTSMEQARIAMCHAFDLKYKTRLSPILPLGIYTIPELAMVGKTEEQATAEGLDVVVGRARFRDNARGQIAGDGDGMIKLLFARGGRKLLGAHIVGERATELIHIASTGLALGATLETFIDAVYNFPTLSELYKYAAYDALGKLPGGSSILPAGVT
jgi:NAD(P) transhydrogenase